MSIERIAETALTPDLDRAIGRLLDAAFDTPFDGRSFYKQRHHLRLVWRDGGAVIGHMALCYRAIRMGDALVDICGLADVATHPDRRGEGIATALMTQAIAAARETPAAFLVLFGDQPLYAASGFVPKANRMRFVAMNDARTIDVREDTDEGLMVLPLRDAAWDDAAPLDLLGPMF